ncbi:GSCFA domain-containing protein [Psychrobacter sp. AOP5-GZ1-6]|uniref:GSCFA domain-containing protein n=1 Tax=unclassified Psychrobacter TaxID=196806 RepID=UPI00402BBB12
MSEIPEISVSENPLARLDKIQARDKPNPRWSTHFKNNLLTTTKKPLFKKTDKIFAVGSCFAERIRTALNGQGFEVGPPMQEIVMDTERFKIDRLPNRPHMDYFNSFTVRQEFERYIGEWKQSEDDYWTINKDPYWGGNTIYQDPYRRMVIGRTPEDLREAVFHCNTAVDKGISEADLFIITFGMAEVFRNLSSGKIACQKPGYSGGAGEFETEFHMSTFSENYENLKKITEIIKTVRPNAQIVFTLSPVSLARTFSDNDILVANSEGKGILRAAIGQIVREYEQVSYFPSYEIVMHNSPESFREDDGRHVSDWVVNRIVDAFVETHADLN